MSKKTNNQAPSPEKKETGNPYNLKIDAVNRLAEADNMPLPKNHRLYDPGKKYRTGFLEKIPGPIKALFVKFWFNGAVCFFIFWGLGILIPNMENMFLILGIVLGMVTDILVNNIFRFFAVVPGENDKWMMFPKKRYVNFFLNILYSFLVLGTVISVYEGINSMGNALNGTTDKIYLGVEPIMFGIFYMGIDMLLISIKNVFVRIIQDAKDSTK